MGDVSAELRQIGVNNNEDFGFLACFVEVNSLYHMLLTCFLTKYETMGINMLLHVSWESFPQDVGPRLHIFAPTRALVRLATDVEQTGLP